MESTPSGSSAVFTASRGLQPGSQSGTRGGGRSFRGGRNNGRNGGRNGGRGNIPRNRQIRCQICRGEGHYASSCRDRYAPTTTSANLAQAFNTCSINEGHDTEWYTDSGATAHMTNDVAQLDKVTAYSGKDCVIVGNGASQFLILILFPPLHLSR